jgi:Ca-activated chloride channel family protein
MAHAKLVLGELIDKLAGSRIGIIAFAGQAYVECPLTVDENAAKDVLDTIDTNTVPIPGTVIGDAIRVAIKGLKAGEGQNRLLVLLTDGEDHRSDPQAAAKEAARVGLKIFPVGIGSPLGEPIPVLDDQGHRTGYKRDKKGEVVMSRLDEQTLIDLAHETGGQYLRAGPTGDEVDELSRRLEVLQQGDQKTKLFNRFENRYQYPLAAGLLLLLISLAIPEMGWRKS